MKENNTCYVVGCPLKPEYEFKTNLVALDNIIVRLCEKHSLEAYGIKDVENIKTAKIKAEGF